MGKRVVLQEASGLWRIVGAEPDEADFKRLDFITFPDGAPPLSLIAVKPRYVLYRECKLLPTGQFNDFHPSQV